jgi:hypothetical protein
MPELTSWGFFETLVADHLEEQCDLQESSGLELL